MIRKEIKTLRAFFQKKEHGWINFLRVDGLMPSGHFILNHTAIAGGVSVSLRCRLQ